VKRGATQLAYRAQWTFAYDRKNRLKSHTNTNASNVRGNLWYDGRGRVWQRWNDNSSTEDWDETLKRFVYDGGALVQEHEFDVAEVEDEWVYTYSDLTRDYLRHPAGVRQRERSGGNDTDYYLEADSGALEFKTERDPVAEAISRTERTSSLNQISGATFSAGLSNLATSNNYIEMYGGGTTGSSAGFDALLLRGSRHYLSGLGRFTSRLGNNPHEPGDKGGPSILPAALPSLEQFIMGQAEGSVGDVEGEKWRDDFVRDKRSIGAQGAPSRACPNCCLQMLGTTAENMHKLHGNELSGERNWRGWCETCCGYWVYLLHGCTEQFGSLRVVYWEAYCHNTCCFVYTPGALGSNELLFDVIQKNLLMQLYEWACNNWERVLRLLEAAGLGALAYCLARCLAAGMTWTCFWNCVQNTIFSKYGRWAIFTVLGALGVATRHLIPEAAGVAICEQIADEVNRWGAGMPAGLVWKCCQKYWHIMVDDFADVDAFLNHLRCCYACHLGELENATDLPEDVWAEWPPVPGLPSPPEGW